MGQLIWISSGWGVLYSTGIAHYFEDTSYDWPLTLCGFTTDSDIHSPNSHSSNGSLANSRHCKRCESALAKGGRACM
jgi:hypothetical protein